MTEEYDLNVTLEADSISGGTQLCPIIRRSPYRWRDRVLQRRRLAAATRLVWKMPQECVFKRAEMGRWIIAHRILHQTNKGGGAKLDPTPASSLGIRSEGPPLALLDMTVTTPLSDDVMKSICQKKLEQTKTTSQASKCRSSAV